MYDVKITAVRQTVYEDLSLRWENPIEEACPVRVGEVWLSHGGMRPEGLCESAWATLRPFVEALAHGEGDFFDGWMKNPYSALLSCNDGFRPMSFLVERVE